MSQTKIDRSFPQKTQAISDYQLARIVAAALHTDFGANASAVKKIGLLTKANLRTVKNWYDGVNAPSAAHLLQLARSSPSIMKFMFEQLGEKDLWRRYHGFSFKKDPHAGIIDNERIDTESTIYSAESCTINVTVALTVAGKLNQRQLWFLGYLQQNRQVKADNIVSQWQVSSRTARADVAGLVETGMIQFVGANRTGKYILVSSPS